MTAIEPYTADDVVEFNGVKMPIRDVPSPTIRAHMGVGHFPGHGREVVPVPGRIFPYTPDTCLTDLYRCEWLPDETRLYCTGCGLDAT